MKSVISKYLNPSAIINAQNLLNSGKKSRLGKLLSSLPDKKQYLSLDDLERLNSQYDPPVSYSYSNEALHQRGATRSVNVYAQTKGISNINNTLEIGAKDGLVSYYLSKNFEKKSTCFDLNPQPLKDLEYTNTEFAKGDVSSMPFEANSFDLTFSFNSFEHFHEPKSALLEMIRVTRSGGLIYLDFGPLYFAPKGLHIYNRVHIPYCQLLFEQDTIDRFYAKNNLGQPKFSAGNGLNAWHIDDYRTLWKEVSDKVELLKLNEYPTYKALDVIARYPEYIKGKINSLDDLIVTRIEILMEVHK